MEDTDKSADSSEKATRQITCYIKNDSSFFFDYNGPQGTVQGQSTASSTISPGTTGNVKLSSSGMLASCQGTFYYGLRHSAPARLLVHLDDPYVGDNLAQLEPIDGAQNLVKVQPTGKQYPLGQIAEITFTVTNA